MAQCKQSACSAREEGLIPGSGRSLDEGMATHTAILAWRIPWTEEPGYSPQGHKESHTAKEAEHTCTQTAISTKGKPCQLKVSVCLSQVRHSVQPLRHNPYYDKQSKAGYDKQCCNEHWGARVSFRSGVLGVYAQKWDCWVIWQLCFQFFKESPHCSP